MFGLTKTDRIKKSHPIIQVIRSYGIDLKENGQGYLAKCPFHADKEPSLRVTPEKALFNCFGCDAGGSVIDFVSRIENISPQEAITRLSSLEHGAKALVESASSSIAPLKSSPSPSLLDDIAKLYHRQLMGNKPAQDYLRSRGFNRPELWEHFQIGYSEGRSLLPMLPKEGGERDYLKSIGLLNERENESFYQCLTFPLKTQDNKTVGFYGRSIEGTRHHYGKGKRRGLFNASTAKAHDWLIITESVLDALSLIELGFLNVIALYGTNGFTQEHKNFLSEFPFKEVVLVLDNDDSGQRATKTISLMVQTLGKKVSSLKLPQGIKDLNEFLCKGFKKSDFEELLKQRSGQENSELGTVKKEDSPLNLKSGMAVFVFSPLSYHLRGLKAKSSESMTVILTTTHKNERYTDRIDLYLSAKRRSYANAVSAKLIVQPAKVEEDLLEILAQVECLQLKEKEEGKEKESKVYQMTLAEKNEALFFLKSKNLIEQIKRDITQLGYVGQDREKLLLYLSASSRITEQPFHVFIRSTSSSGKSDMMEKVISLFPPEKVESFSRISNQSLFYMESLKNKVVIVDEQSGIEGAELAMRSLMSQGKLSLAVVQRDPQTGESKTVTIEVEGPCAVWSSTTHARTEDNMNRVFECFLDETPSQTKQIHELQRKTFSPLGWDKKNRSEKVINTHRNAQRLLKNLKVHIPFSDKINFPHHSPRTRRDFMRFLSLIANIALLHQYQRPVLKTASGVPYIEASLSDYKWAYTLIHEVLENTYALVERDSRRLLELSYTKICELSKQAGVSWKAYSFNRKLVREWTQYSDWKVRQCLRELSSLEYITPAINKGRTGYRYTLAVSPDALLPEHSKLSSPEDMEKRIKIKVEES